MIGDRVGSVDITLYRDDLSEIGSSAVVRTTEIPFSIDGLHVVLVDDVLMTGRSVRAALQSLMDLGRPRRIWLAVLVDRGGRELPIAPDHVALDLTKGNTVKPDDIVAVHLKPSDPGDQITVEPRRKGGAVMAQPAAPYRWPHKHLLGLEELSRGRHPFPPAHRPRF